MTALLPHDLGAAGKDFFVDRVVEVEESDEAVTLNDVDLDELLVDLFVVEVFRRLGRVMALEDLR